MTVEDIASQSSVVFGIQHDWRYPISGVHVSPGSAETLVRRSGITNYRSLAYSLSNVSAKNYESRLMLIYIAVVFWDTVYMLLSVSDYLVKSYRTHLSQMSSVVALPPKNIKTLLSVLLMRVLITLFPISDWLFTPLMLDIILVVSINCSLNAQVGSCIGRQFRSRVIGKMQTNFGALFQKY